MIEVKNVVKTFDGFNAVDNATLTVKKGSVYGLVGPNGAGKSTIIRNILGIYKPDAGEILIDSEPVYENSEIKKRIAAIPDDWFYFSNATVKDMMKLYKGVYESFDMERYEKLKEAFNIPENKTIKTCSKGMKKQIAFWLSLSVRPDYLILDEPVDGLDPVMRRQVWSLILGDVAENGTTVLVSSHNLRELEDVCDEVGIMNKGKLLLERSLNDLQDNMVKLQVAFPSEVELSKDLPILHISKLGRVYTIIMRMNQSDAIKALSPYAPIFVDAIPLNLEEIFIYELGGENYEAKDILL